MNAIVDVNNLFNRAYHIAVKYRDIGSTPFRFYNMVRNFSNRLKITELRFASDCGYSFRRENFGGYKAQRPKKGKDYVNYLERVLICLDKCTMHHYRPLKVTETSFCEADDIIASFCHHGKKPILIISNDGDMSSFLTQDVSIWNFRQVVTPQTFFEKMGFEAKLNIKYKAVLGDNSDNIPGVPRIGQALAKRLVQNENDPINQSVDPHRDLVAFNMALMSPFILINEGLIRTFPKHSPVDLRSLRSVIKEEFND